MDCEALNNSICPPGSREMVNICGYFTSFFFAWWLTAILIDSFSPKPLSCREQGRQQVEKLVRGNVLITYPCCVIPDCHPLTALCYFLFWRLFAESVKRAGRQSGLNKMPDLQLLALLLWLRQSFPAGVLSVPAPPDCQNHAWPL